MRPVRSSKKRQRRKSSCSLGANKEHCIGFCHLHKCNLSARQMRNRKCLQKQCARLQRYEDHPYWQKRKEIRELRNERRGGTESERL